MKLSNHILQSGKLTFFLLPLIFLSGCGNYSFTGTSIDPNVETMSIARFYNDVGSGPADLSQRFTQQIRDHFQQNTRLSVVKNGGDLQLEGSVVRYEMSPAAPRSSGNNQQVDQAGLMRLQITVRAVFINTYNEKHDFDRTFSQQAEYNPNESSLQAEEDRMINEIFEDIIYAIFNASVANW